MGYCNSLISISTLIIVTILFYTANAINSKLFREYIGAESDTIRLSDIPINPDVEVHFILSFAIDYTTTKSHVPTDGNFNVFWATKHLSPQDISTTKQKYRNVKFAVSLGGDTVAAGKYAYFSPNSVDSWVRNAVLSITKMVREFGLDGIDIDYEHFKTNPDVFADCIGQLITILKKNKVISFASIAPYDNDMVQDHYQSLWKKYGHLIDYVNFQFYAYDPISIPQFIGHFNQQARNYNGGQLLVSFESGRRSGGLHPDKGFFEACNELKDQEKLGGIFVWCAEESSKTRFQYEKKSQELLAS